MTPEEVRVALAAIGSGSALVAFVTAAICLTVYRFKMARLRLDGKASAQTDEKIEALRQELAAFRDTATHYDMSFDTALQRVESRLSRLESAERDQMVETGIVIRKG